MAEKRSASPARETKRDSDLLVSLRHPLRRQILRAMIAADAPISPRMLAEELDEPLSNVSYHVRVLADHETVRLHDTEQVRGSLRHDYEPSVEEPWALAVLALGGEDPAPDDGADATATADRSTGQGC